MKDKPLGKVIAEKSELLNNIIAKKFGNSNAAALGGQETNEGGGNEMRVTRSSASNAPGEVQDGKLVNVKQLASAAAKQDVPPTDLMALARQNDPHNEENIPETIAGAVISGAPVTAEGSKALGDVEKEQKDSLHSKQHKPMLNAVETDVKSQTSETDQYKTLHAGKEIEEIVARAKAVIKGAADIKAVAEGEVSSPSAGDPEPREGVTTGDDAGKNAEDSAATLASGKKPATTAEVLDKAKNRKDVLAAIKAKIAETRKAKVEGHPIDPAKGEDAGKTPEESAKTMGDGGGKEKLAKASNEQLQKLIVAGACGYDTVDPELAKAATAEFKRRQAEQKDRPLASMPEGKPRYDKDKDNRDENAESYWAKNRADQKRYDSEPAADRPITRETQDKMPKLAPKAERRRDLLTRLAGLESVLAADNSEAQRLRLQRKQYSKDTPKDMDFEGAASRTQAEIKKEHGQRTSDNGVYSPMMSRLWSAFGPEKIKTAADETGYKGSLGTSEGDSSLRAQIEELRTALKGLKAEDEGSDQKMDSMHSKIEGLEGDLEKASGVQVGANGLRALASAFERLSAMSSALRDVHRLCAASHLELRFSMEKPEAMMDETKKLLEDLGETAEDMSETIDKALGDLGGHDHDHDHKDKDDEKGGPPKDDKAPFPPKGEAEPSGDPSPIGGGAPSPMGGDKPAFMASDKAPVKTAKAPVKTAMEAEEEKVEAVASDCNLQPKEKKAQIDEIRKGSSLKVVFSKVASKEDATKADMVSSYWSVMRGDEIVLKASVGELYPVKSAEEKAKAFAWCATKDYGRKLLSAVKYEGLVSTAKVLGLSPMTKSAAGKTNEKGYYSKAYGSSEYASELLKDHEKRSKAAIDALSQRVAAAELKSQAEKERNDRLEADIAMRSKAERCLRLANTAITKGLFAEDKKASFIDTLMQTKDEAAFKATATIVEDYVTPPVPSAPAPTTEGETKEAGKTTAKDMIRQAAAGPGLKTAVTIAGNGAAAGLSSQLESIWKKPPTAQ